MSRFFNRRKQKDRPDKTSASLDGGLEADEASKLVGRALPNEAEKLLDHGSKKAPKMGLGIQTLYEPQQPSDACVDIVFVHGLTGSSSNTWFHENSGKYWPTDFLSQDIPNSRILAFGYDADVIHFWGVSSGNRIGDHASKLLGDLTRLREGSDSESRKVVFVAHSLGGLVVQDCLWLSKGHAEPHLNGVASCAVGIVFLGTPHHGADLAAWAKFGSSIANIVKRSNKNIIDVLKPRSEVLARVQDGFHTLVRQRGRVKSDLAITCFFEELPLPVVGKVVETNSAVLPGYSSYGIHANHMGMTKFSTKDNDGYKSILGELRRWLIKIHATQDSTQTMKALFLVPFLKDSAFVDRMEIFEKIEGQMSRQRRVTLSGIGGIGKSQIAIEYCYRFRNIYANAHVIWVYAGTIQRFHQSYKDVARRLELPGWEDPKLDTSQLVAEWFSDSLAGRWLMVLDNADDLDVIFKKATPSGTGLEPQRSLVEYLPNSSTGSILITTRDNRVGQRLRLGSNEIPIVVSFMSLAEGQELLQSQLGLHNDSKPEDSEALIETLGYIPLAITQAAAFIHQNSSTLAEYLYMLNNNDSEIQALLQEDSGDLRRDSESQNAVIRTWKLAFDLIQRQRPRATDILSLMSVLDRQGIPRSLLEDEFDRNVDTTTALGVLQAFSLIGIRDGAAKYELHRLTQLATQKWLEIQGTKDKWQQNALQRLEDAFPDGEFENWVTCELLLPHALKVLANDYVKEEYALRKASLSFRVGVFDMRQGRYEDANHRLSTALTLNTDIQGVEDHFTLACMTEVASLFRNRGHWDEAEQLQEQVLDTRKRVLKANHPDTLKSMANLAETYWNQGRWDEAEQLQEQVIEAKKRVLKADHPDTLMSMSNLAATYVYQGRWDEAEQLEVQVIGTKKRVLKADHPHTLTSMANLAETYINQGRWDEAEQLQEQVLDTRKRVLKVDHPDTLSSIRNLAGIYIYQGRWDEAEQLHKQVLDIHKRVLKVDHPDTLTSMANLAVTYLYQGRWDEAEQLQIQVIEASKRVLKADHPDTLSSMRNLAATYLYQGRWDKAEELQMQVIEASKRVLKADHPDTLSSMRNLAATYLYQGRWDEAEQLQEQVIEASKRVLKADHPDTLTSMANLVATYRNQGRLDQAEQLEEQILDTRRRVLKADHPDTLNSMVSLAVTYWNQGRLDEAEQLEEQVLDTRKRVLKADHPDTLMSMANLAMTYWTQDHHTKAVDLMRSVVNLRTKKLGKDHPDTVGSITLLKQWDEVPSISKTHK